MPAAPNKPPADLPLFFPMMVNIKGRKCLVVGAGKIAADKITDLLLHGAGVTVVSPLAIRAIQNMARSGKVKWLRRSFSPNDAHGAFLVIAATNSITVNSAVFRACQKQGVLCNAVDDPENCDFFYPAIVRRGPLQIAISTNGQSPALASRLRKELEQQFGPEWKVWVEHLGGIRRQLLSEDIPAKKRRELLIQSADPKAFAGFMRKYKSTKQTR